MTITADGTIGINSTGDMTLDSQQILLLLYQVVQLLLKH